MAHSSSSTSSSSSSSSSSSWSSSASSLMALRVSNRQLSLNKIPLQPLNHRRYISFVICYLIVSIFFFHFFFCLFCFSNSFGGMNDLTSDAGATCNMAGSVCNKLHGLPIGPEET